MKFSNPILPFGADPWFIFKDGWYYYIYSENKEVDSPNVEDSAILIAKSQTITGMKDAKAKVVWKSKFPKGTNQELWAPELHYIRNHWYIYVAGLPNLKSTIHQMYVLESKTIDPLDGFNMKGPVSDENHGWAIDGTVLLKDNGELYFIWSGADENLPYPQQNLYIAPMRNPWTLGGIKTCISKPEYKWERIHHLVNEGPSILKRNGKYMIVYSASHSFTDDYCLGLLINETGDITNPNAWKKHPKPIFRKSKTVFGPGHASFTVSPDGTEDWIIYHSAKHSNAAWDRHVHAQPFKWSSDGLPLLGKPVGIDKEILLPSGEIPLLGSTKTF